MLFEGIEMITSRQTGIGRASHTSNNDNNNSDYNFTVKGNIHDVTKITGTMMKNHCHSLFNFQFRFSYSHFMISFSSMICFYALLLIYKAELDRVYASNNIYFFWACFYATSTRINLVLKVNRKVFDNIRYNI